MERREFLKQSVASAGVLGMSHIFKKNINKDIDQSSREPANMAELPKRNYGKTGIKLSIIGFGGIVVMNEPQEHAKRVVAQAIERGVNYFDVATSYGDAEIKLGPALEPYRKDVFLACKTGLRTKAEAVVEFKQSLKNLRTDHFDLYQLHGIVDVEGDVDVAFAKGGVMEMALEARKQGQIRHLGFSAHTHAAALAAMDRYDFDSILFPINFATFYKGNLGPPVIQKAKEKGIAILALKSLARQQWPKNDPNRDNFKKCWYQPLSDPKEAGLGLKFTLSQPVTAAIPPGEEKLFTLALDIAMNFRPLTSEENEKLKILASKLNPIFSA